MQKKEDSSDRSDLVLDGSYDLVIFCDVTHREDLDRDISASLSCVTTSVADTIRHHLRYARAAARAKAAVPGVHTANFGPQHPPYGRAARIDSHERIARAHDAAAQSSPLKPA